MREAIIEKIVDHLCEGVNREADVVYLFVQIRKLFEHDNLPQYPQLQFYCDWVAHTKLSRIRRDGALAEYLKKINEAVAAYALRTGKQYVASRITDAISFDRLRDEMTTFFKERNLDDAIMQIGNWGK